MQRFHHAAARPLVVLLLFSASLAASAAVPLVDEKVRQLMQEGDYAKALEAIDAAAKPENAPKDYLAYLKGRALFLQKQYDEAVAAFAVVETQFPKSPWARRARFAGALALARKGDFRGAELIFRKEAEHLLSENRKQEIADIYLEFADAFFDPPEDQKKPDYQKALEFYQKALEVGPKAEKRVELELLVAECHRGLDKFAEAAALYAKFIDDHPEGPLNLKARFYLGDCRLAEGKPKEARRAWEDLLAKHPDSRSDEIAEAWYKLSRTWQVPKPGNDRQLALGVGALEAFIERFPTHRHAGQAHLEIAQCYIHRGRYEDAVTSLGRFLADQRYQDHKRVPDARNLLGRSYQLQRKFTEALATWREYLSKHPTHGEWSSVQREIINTEHLMAREKYQTEEYAAAGKLWGEFTVKYPLDDRNPSIFYLFGEMAYRQEKWGAAIADWRRLVSKYPKTDPSSRAQFMIAATLEQKLAQPADALEEYRKVTWGNHAAKAKQAIARLTAKTMSVATERKFRSDETPKLKLFTRNIESVTVRAYKVDLETYFRKMHLARGVEALDVALIDPDATFEFKIPDYAKHRELESTVEVAMPEEATSGVMAVTVASKTLEATTLVIQSDLDVIVKSSRDEVFVFAQNMRTGKAWPEARLLISNGKEVFANGATGPDGVFQQEYKQLKEAGDTRVFAASAGHVASNLVSLEGVGASQGLSDRGYIYTDRPAYRAGQLVHVRGCIRHVPGSAARSVPPPPAAPSGPSPAADPFAPSPADDAAPSGPGPAVGESPPTANSPLADTYVIEDGKKYSVKAFDGRNRLVWEEEVALSPFGTFHLHFVLPPTSPQGAYRVLAEDTAGRTFQGTFQVHQYKLEPVRLVVDTPRKVYYRGEEIEGTLRASFYYGAPLQGREIRYQLADDRLHTAQTDEKGEVHFKLPTREFQET
ncbi:MAG: tetratricopeptide repeat protein, partial [Planctomycetes bacterium]|nr:tetratricopeptide repeat protein [Planctomycetota bacterium]